MVEAGKPVEMAVAVAAAAKAIAWQGCGGSGCGGGGGGCSSTCTYSEKGTCCPAATVPADVEVAVAAGIAAA